MKPAREDIELTREDGGTYTFKPVKGDYTGRLNYVTFRENIDPVTGDRLLEKSSAAGQVRCIYDAAKKESIFEFDYLPNDTRDRPQSQLVYDITSISVSDATDVKTPKIGYCKLIGDVRNDLNGTDLPADGERYIPVLASQFDDGSFIKTKIENNKKTFFGYQSLRNSVFDLDVDGGLMPKDSIDFDDVYEIDGNGDIMPKEII